MLGAAVLALTGCTTAEKHAAPGTTATTTPAAPQPRKPVHVWPHNRPVPILTYHVVGTPPADAPFLELYVSRSEFAAQLRWLRSRGYHAVRLGRVYDYWTHGLALPARPIVLHPESSSPPPCSR